jgi:ubiquinone/menaquinone biosynthesis C-methylase UbiE
MADSLHLPHESRVLEVGCGAGLTSVALARRGYRVEATDAVRVMIEQTRKAASGSSVAERIHTSLCDVHKLTFPDDLFDLVLAVGVIPWMDSPLQPLREMLRVTKPGAFLILTVSNRWSLNQVLDPICFPLFRPIRWKVRSSLERLGLYHRDSTKLRHAFHSIREFDAMLQSVGVEKIRGITVGFGPFTFIHCRLFSESTAIKVHNVLQRQANRGTICIRSAGEGYIVLAKKDQFPSHLHN